MYFVLRAKSVISERKKRNKRVLRVVDSCHSLVTEDRF